MAPSAVDLSYRVWLRHSRESTSVTRRAGLRRRLHIQAGPTRLDLRRRETGGGQTLLDLITTAEPNRAVEVTARPSRAKRYENLEGGIGQGDPVTSRHCST